MLAWRFTRRIFQCINNTFQASQKSSGYFSSLLKFAFFFRPLPVSLPQKSHGHPIMPPHLFFSLAWAVCLVAEIGAEGCSVPITWLPTEHTFLSKLPGFYGFSFPLLRFFFSLMFFCHCFSSEHLSNVCGGGSRSVLSGLHITEADFVVFPKEETCLKATRWCVRPRKDWLCLWG